MCQFSLSSDLGWNLEDKANEGQRGFRTTLQQTRICRLVYASATEASSTDPRYWKQKTTRRILQAFDGKDSTTGHGRCQGQNVQRRWPVTRTHPRVS